MATASLHRHGLCSAILHVMTQKMSSNLIPPFQGVWSTLLSQKAQDSPEKPRNNSK